VEDPWLPGLPVSVVVPAPELAIRAPVAPRAVRSE